MPMVRNVSISDATHQIAANLSGNLEYQLLDLNNAPGVAAQLKKGAYYTATDGGQRWKVMFKNNDAQYLHFEVM